MEPSSIDKKQEPWFSPEKLNWIVALSSLADPGLNLNFINSMYEEIESGRGMKPFSLNSRGVMPSAIQVCHIKFPYDFGFAFAAGSRV
jgi:hypothetical protein